MLRLPARMASAQEAMANDVAFGSMDAVVFGATAPKQEPENPNRNMSQDNSHHGGGGSTDRDVVISELRWERGGLSCDGMLVNRCIRTLWEHSFASVGHASIEASLRGVYL